MGNNQGAVQNGSGVSRAEKSASKAESGILFRMKATVTNLRTTENWPNDFRSGHRQQTEVVT